jgi:predicted DNA-binding transcriptional regulator AlpA
MARPEVIIGEEPDALSIPIFCARHGISRGTYYNLRAAGLGPNEMRLGTRVLISRESAAEWRRRHTSDTTTTNDHEAA